MQRPDTEPVLLYLQALVTARVPWTLRGLDPATGLGCYGLIHLAYALLQIALPPTAEEGVALFQPIDPPYQAMDVVCLRPGPLTAPRHLGLLVAPTWGFHHGVSTNGVARFTLQDRYWHRGRLQCWRYEEWATCA